MRNVKQPGLTPSDRPFVSAENLRVDGVANPRIAGYTDKENKIVYLRRDEKLPDYKAMKTLGHESLGHAQEREKTGKTTTTLGEEVGARVIGENLMIDAKRLDAVDPKSLGADGKPSADAIKAQLSTPDMKKSYNQRVVPKDAPPPKMPVVTADKTIPILVPKPKPPVEAPPPPPPPPPPPEDEKKKKP